MNLANNQKFETFGQNEAAPFVLKLYRGEGMTLLAMNWKKMMPPADFVGFAIEYLEPGGDRFYSVQNRLSFPGMESYPNSLSTRLAPIQKFRWIHFPRNADLDGEFTYKVTPVFMNPKDELSYGEPQEGKLILKQETYPGQLNIAFTRGFVSSQAFVDRFSSTGYMAELIPGKAEESLNFVPTHPKSTEALAWMGFEARQAILDVLDQAIADQSAQVRVIAYDLNEPEVISRLQKLKSRLKIIIDDDGPHEKRDSPESITAQRLIFSAGRNNVKRQHMGKLQHNKTIVVAGTNLKVVVCGSTNFSWRGIYVQSNNAIIIKGDTPIVAFLNAFNNYWENDTPADFGKTNSCDWSDLGLTNIDARICFSPHSEKNAVLDLIAEDIRNNTTSNLFYSLAFLHLTEGQIRETITDMFNNDQLFIYGISDKKLGGLNLQKPNGNLVPVFPAILSKNLPEPFKSEPTGGIGTRMHHKFIIIDFNKPTARVYVGSYNFSSASDTSNGENLLCIRDRRIAVSYLVEALRIFDHYHFRVAQLEAKTAKTKLSLSKPPRSTREIPWWSEYYTDAVKIRDRELFVS